MIIPQTQAPPADTFTPQALHDHLRDELAAVEDIFARELESDVPFVASLVRHIGGFRGKMLRPTLLLLSADACGGIRREHHVLAAVVEMVHVATLVHDDILDESFIRRGRATVNQKWGNENAVLLGDFLISHSYHLCSSLPDAGLSRLVAAATNTVCEGELMQVSRRGDLDLTPRDYTEIVARKTGCLTGLAARLGAKVAGAESAVCDRLCDYGMHLGIAFQIVDDVLDLTGDPEEVGKTLGTDLIKGKLTLPMIHLLAAGSARRRAELEEILRTDPLPQVGEIRRRLIEAGSLDFAMAAAEQRVADAVACLRDLAPGRSRDLLVESARHAIHRKR